jgi:hypothetical protein
VQYASAPVHDFGNFLYRLYRAHFVVGKHDADQYGIGAHKLFKRVGFNLSVFVDPEIRYVKSLFSQPFGGIEDCVMLYCGNDNVLSLILSRKRRALQSPVVRFRTATREVNFIGFDSQRVGNLFSRRVNSTHRVPAEGMLTVRIAEIFVEERHHGNNNVVVARSGRGVIQINAIFSRRIYQLSQ